MGCSRGMDLVDGIGHRVQRGVEPKRDFRGRQIVVDRLGHAHDLHALLEKFVADLLRPIPANRNDGVDAQLLGVGDDLVGDVAHHLLPVFFSPVVERIAAIGGAQNRAAARQNPAHAVERKLKRFLRPDQPVKTIGNADDFPLVFEDGSFGGGANDSVEAGCVPASGGNADTAYV